MIDHDESVGTRGEVLTDGRRWGERFVALRGAPDGPEWITAADLFGSGLSERLAAVGEARGTTSPAVAATLLLDVYAQRVVAPVLAALYVERTVVDASLPLVRLAPAGGGFRRLAFAADPRPVGSRAARDARSTVLDGLIDAHLEIAVDVLHRRTRAGTRALRGTVAHALAITFLHLSWPGPDRARFVDAAAEVLAERPELAGLATVTAVSTGGEPWMYTDRAACCLAFRTSVNRARDMPYCATCPVVAREHTKDLFDQATAAFRRRQDDDRHRAP